MALMRSRRSLRTSKRFLSLHVIILNLRVVPISMEVYMYLPTSCGLRIHVIASQVQNSVSIPNKFHRVTAFFLEQLVRLRH